MASDVVDKVFGIEELLYRILMWLPIGVLDSTRSVSKLWYEVTKQIITERTKNKRHCEIQTVSIDKNQNLQQLIKNISTAAKEFLTPLRYVILLCDKSQRQIGSKVLEKLPSSCKTLYCVKSLCIIHSAEKNSEPDSQRIQLPENESMKGMCALLISASDGFCIDSFGNDDNDDLETVLGHEEVKAIVMLTNSRRDIQRYFSTASKNNPKVIFSGAAASSVVEYKRTEEGFPRPEKKHGFTIKGPHIKTASCVMTPIDLEVDDEEETIPEIENQLDNLKNTGICTGNSFAMFFPCCARYSLESFYLLPQKMQQYEFKPFQQRFPNTPMIGFYGEICEIGHDCFPNYTQVEDSGKPAAKKIKQQHCVTRCEDLYHGLTTVVLVVDID